MKSRIGAVAMGAVAFSLLIPSAAMAQQAVDPKSPPPASKMLGTSSLDVKNAPIRDVLSKFFEQAKIDYSLDKSVQGYVTLKATDQPFEVMLRLLLRSNSIPLTWVGGGVYIVKARVPQPGVVPASSASIPVAPQPGEAAKLMIPVPSTKAEDKAPAEQKVSLDLKNALIRDALDKMFRQTKSDFSLDGSVQGYVTLKITDQPLETALRLLLRSSSVSLTFTKESGVYFIKPRRTGQSAEIASPSPQGATTPISVVSSGPATLIADQDGNRLLALNREGKYIDTISLTYLDPADIAELFNIIQVPSFTRQMGNGVTQGRTGQFGNGTSGPRS